MGEGRPVLGPGATLWGAGKNTLLTLSGGVGGDEWAKVWPWWLLFAFLTLSV